MSEKQLLEETSFRGTPLRETLLMLQPESLIEIFLRKGMRIIALIEKSVDDLYQTRKLIEPTVCRKCTTLYSKSRPLEFQKMFEWVEDASDAEEYRIDTSFHPYLIGIMSSNTLINMYHSTMARQMRMVMYVVVQDSSNRMGNLK